jgi:hypothetical protein
VRGEVLYNDGDVAEIRTIRIDGIELGLLLNTVQIHGGVTEDAPEEFQQTFKIGTQLYISMTVEIAIRLGGRGRASS